MLFSFVVPLLRWEWDWGSDQRKSNVSEANDNVSKVHTKIYWKWDATENVSERQRRMERKQENSKQSHTAAN